MFTSWNLWHGCKKLSEGCKNCYVYRGDSKRGIDSSVVHKTTRFNLPIQKKRNGEYKVASGALMATCFTSDFFLEEADEWRIEAWQMIKERSDLHFFMITKRIDRFFVNLPNDWGSGYENVTIGCTVENQDRANYRLPLLCAAPIKRKMIICEPLLEEINLQGLVNSSIIQVVAGGESGNNARICNYKWILSLKEFCVHNNMSFWFKQTGTYLQVDNKLHKIQRRLQHSQARKANINCNVKMF